jgi:pimeloyl-ACP methyl ester carboxylesterase
MTPIVVIPGLYATPRFYEAQLAELWQRGPVQFANHTRDDTIAAIATRILDEAPARFALVGHSMGGYIAFEILRQARSRVARVALLDTSARADAPEQTQRRREMIALASKGRYEEIADLQFPLLVHPARRDDADLRAAVRGMARDTGAAAFIRQENAIIGRIDSRPTLGEIRCPTLVLVGEQDGITPLDRAEEIVAGISGASLVTVPDCGHMSAMERPQAVTAALAAFFAA